MNHRTLDAYDYLDELAALDEPTVEPARPEPSLKKTGSQWVLDGIDRVTVGQPGAARKAHVCSGEPDPNCDACVSEMVERRRA